MKRIWKNNRGEGSIDIAVMILVVAFVLIFSVNMVSLVALNQNMKTVADQIIDYATAKGTTDVDEYVSSLKNKTGIDFTYSFAGTDYHQVSSGKVQLGDVIVVTVRYSVSVLGFGEVGFPITLEASSQGISQVYHK